MINISEKCEAYENPLIENLFPDHIKREIEGQTQI